MTVNKEEPKAKQINEMSEAELYKAFYDLQTMAQDVNNQILAVNAELAKYRKK